MGGTTRRQVIVGGAALALSLPGTPASPVQQISDDDDLIILSVQMQRLHRRVQALHWNMRTVDDTDAWQRWSEAHDQLSGLCDRISRTPVSTMAGLAVRYEALVLGLLDDGVLMDDGIRRQVLVLRRDMRRLASPAAQQVSRA